MVDMNTTTTTNTTTVYLIQVKVADIDDWLDTHYQATDKVAAARLCELLLADSIADWTAARYVEDAR